MVMDSMRAHITPAIKQGLTSKKIKPSNIPGGMTKNLRLLNLTVNRSFKARVRCCRKEWVSNGEVEIRQLQGTFIAPRTAQSRVE